MAKIKIDKNLILGAFGIAILLVSVFIIIQTTKEKPKAETDKESLITFLMDIFSKERGAVVPQCQSIPITPEGCVIRYDLACPYLYCEPVIDIDKRREELERLRDTVEDKGIVNEIIDGIVETPGNIYEFVFDTRDTIIKEVSTGLGETADKIGDVAEDILKAPGEAYDWFVDEWGNRTRDVRQGLDDVQDWGNEQINNIGDWFAGWF